jgi:uncharacterized protein (TIGR03000 family)
MYRFFTWRNLAALALLGLLAAPQIAAAQQGWPINGDNWSSRGSSGGYSSYPGSYRGSYYSPGYYYPTPTPASNTQGINYQSRYYTPQAETAGGARDRTAQINVSAPADAEIWFNDAKTTQKGNERLFVSPPLTAKENYYYEMKIKWTKDGKVVEQNRRVTVHAGDVINLDFNAAPTK